MSTCADHTWRFVAQERAPTGPTPEHTVFFVMVCTFAECGAVTVFPYENFKLATEAFKTEFLGNLWACGLWLVDPPTTTIEPWESPRRTRRLDEHDRPIDDDEYPRYEWIDITSMTDPPDVRRLLRLRKIDQDPPRSS